MSTTKTAAEALLQAMAEAGIDYLFANAGTDFPPIIEALAKDGTATPKALTIAHEGVAVAMAHGAWLASGRVQAVMVHVNVGLANAVMGLINARSDDVPMLMMSGRTPLTEAGRTGHRMSPVQYGQEMYDQTGLVRELVKFDYELRYPEQAAALVHRALAITKSAPMGPSYLSLPKEPLSEPVPEGAAEHPAPPAASPAQIDPDASVRIRDWLVKARSAAIVCQRGDPEGRLGPLISTLAEKTGATVYEPFTVRNVLAASDPAFGGYRSPAPDHDLILVIDSQTPWIEATSAPDPNARVVHIGPDPHVSRLPIRGFRSDLAVTADPVLAVAALLDGMDGKPTPRTVRDWRPPTPAPSDPMSTEWMSHCVGQIMDDETLAFSELGLLPEYLDLTAQNRHFNHAHSGGLGWALPAALGAQVMRPGKLTIACMGDGSYMFANPVACHLASEALGLPVLTIVKNNATWNAVRRSVLDGYPEGAAVRANTMPLTDLSPIPDFAAIARASRGHAETITDGAALPEALERAVTIIRDEKRPVLLDCHVALSDHH